MSVLSTEIIRAIEILNNNDLVAIPTETVYGLAGNAYSEKAVSKIFEAKKRPSFDPLIVHTSAFERAQDFCVDIRDEAWKLAEQFSPGPITYILKKGQNIPDLVTSGHATVGVRIPRHPLTKVLLESLDFPLAAPSANPFGYVSPTTAAHVEKQLGDVIPMILDGGPSTVGVESTIIDLSTDKIKILRLGGLAIEEIEEVLGKKIDQIKTSSSKPNAPGMLISHYSPGKPLILGPLNWDYINLSKKKVGVLSFGLTPEVKGHVQNINLSKEANLLEAAQNLFKSLRLFADSEVEEIYADFLPEKGLGRAINDRLKRAATKKL